MTADGRDPDWWRQAVVYQIYPRSFADENGDGIGDLKGITSRVPYLHSLGVDAVWLSPFYPSPLMDGGYDVADYRDVDPLIGNLEDFDQMVVACKSVGIRVIIDIVPNHTSDEHDMFRKAVRSPPGSKERDLFIFREGRGPNKTEPPNDWQASLEDGSAWEPSGMNDGQFYLHMFTKGQPEWNWANDDVRKDFLKTLRFWGDRGVSGFRVDVAHGLVKDLSEPYLPWSEIQARQKRLSQNGNQEVHPLWDRDELFEVYAEWRKVFNEYSPPLMAVAEAWVAADRKHLYATKQSLGQVFSFDLVVSNFDSRSYRAIIENSLDLSKASGSSTTWVLSNHDLVRHATRYGLPDNACENNNIIAFMMYYNESLRTGFKNPAVDSARGLRRALAGTLMILGLPGSTYIYQGEELGLPEVAEISPSRRQDPMFTRTGGSMIGRDGCRVPLPWKASAPNYGFSTGSSHLPQPLEFESYSVDLQEADINSTLNVYRKALRLRKKLQTVEEVAFLESEPGVLHFRRPNGWHVVLNANKHPVSRPKGEILLSSAKEMSEGFVTGETTIWLQRQ